MKRVEASRLGTQLVRRAVSAALGPMGRTAVLAPDEQRRGYRVGCPHSANVRVRVPEAGAALRAPLRPTWHTHPADRIPGNVERMDAGMGRQTWRHEKEFTYPHKPRFWPSLTEWSRTATTGSSMATNA